MAGNRVACATDELTQVIVLYTCYNNVLYVGYSTVNFVCLLVFLLYCAVHSAPLSPGNIQISPPTF